MTKEAADRVKQIREYLSKMTPGPYGMLVTEDIQLAALQLFTDAEWLLSQLSASEERVRALTELLRQSIAYFNGYVQDEAVEEEICVDHEHHVAAQKFKQALKEAESLLPSPPQDAAASLPEHDPGKSIPYVDYFGMSNVSQPSPSGDALALVRQFCPVTLYTSEADRLWQLDERVKVAADWLRSHDAKVPGQAEKRLKKSLLDMLHNHGCESVPCNACKSARAALQESPSGR